MLHFKPWFIEKFLQAVGSEKHSQQAYLKSYSTNKFNRYLGHIKFGRVIRDARMLTAIISGCNINRTIGPCFKLSIEYAQLAVG